MKRFQFVFGHFFFVGIAFFGHLADFFHLGQDFTEPAVLGCELGDRAMFSGNGSHFFAISLNGWVQHIGF